MAERRCLYWDLGIMSNFFVSQETTEFGGPWEWDWRRGLDMLPEFFILIYHLKGSLPVFEISVF